MTALVAPIVAVSLIAAALMLRGRTLRCYLAFEIFSLAVAFVLWRLVSPFDGILAAVAFGVTKLAAFSIFVAIGREVRWSANRFAAVAALVYALVIPSQMRVPIDGDEPYYLLMTESLIADRDLDLRNQYADLSHTASGRRDLLPQPGDPVGPRGEQYSRHEPFLPILLIPGYLLGGLAGTLATIALFGVLLVRSSIRFLEDEGISEATVRTVAPLLAFGPPVVFYAARIWPEVPAAFFLVESVRAIRNRRLQRWLPALFGLILLKLRFGLIGAILLARLAWERRGRIPSIAFAALAVPLLIAWWISGKPLQAHLWRELAPFPFPNYAIGLFGLVADGAAGFFFRAPFYFIGILALGRWKAMPEGFRLGCITGIVYLFYLVPRSEWHGGWSPPLRYVVVFTPILALGAAALLDATRRGVLFALMALWTTGLTIHGLAYSWRLFHIANGENAVGEWLSLLHRTDFSRLFPSFIRLNHAAVIASVAFVLLLAFFAFVRISLPPPLVAASAAVALALFVASGFQPGRRVEFEDEHTVKRGGELFPEVFTVARFRFRGGWILRDGESIEFLSRGGAATLHYQAPFPVLIEIAGRAYPLRGTGDRHATARVEAPRRRVVLRCASGVVNLDRMDFDE